MPGRRAIRMHADFTQQSGKQNTMGYAHKLVRMLTRTQ
jgi:hypothetical protein